MKLIIRFRHSCMSREGTVHARVGFAVTVGPSFSLIYQEPWKQGLPRTVRGPDQCQSTSYSKFHVYCHQRWASAIFVGTSAIPQYCGQAIRLRNCGLKKSCGTAIEDLQNLTFAMPQLSAVSGQFHYGTVLSSPFSSAQDGFKKQPTIFLELFVSMENKNLP